MPEVTHKFVPYLRIGNPVVKLRAEPADLVNEYDGSPDDLSLVTRDFSGVAEFWNPPLTVMRTDYNALSVSALDLLVRLVRGERPSADVAIPG